MIHDLSLYNSVFHIPTAITDIASAPVASPELSLTACTILHDLLFPSSSSKITTRPHPTLLAHASSDRGTRARLFLSASLYSFAGITYKDHKQKVHPLVEAVVREGLKLGNKNYYLDGIPALFDAAALLNGLSLEDNRFTTPSERVGIGMWENRHRDLEGADNDPSQDYCCDTARCINQHPVHIGLRHCFSPWCANWFRLGMVRPNLECTMF